MLCVVRLLLFCFRNRDAYIRYQSTRSGRQASSAMCNLNLDRQESTTAIRRTRDLPRSHAGPGFAVDRSRLLKAAPIYFSLFFAARRPQMF